MKRRTDPDDAPPLPPHGVAPPPAEPDSKPCPGCRTHTPLADLATYGNRCGPCYRAYCNAIGGKQLAIADRRVGGPLAWARTIVERHRAGHSVSRAALDMAESALAQTGRAGSTDDDA